MPILHIDETDSLRETFARTDDIERHLLGPVAGKVMDIFMEQKPFHFAADSMGYGLNASTQRFFDAVNEAFAGDSNQFHALYVIPELRDGTGLVKAMMRHNVPGRG